MTDETKATASVVAEPDDDDAELEAMGAITKALKPLTPATRQRVIGWAAGKYGAAIASAATGLPGLAVGGLGGRAASELPVAAKKRRKTVRKNGVGAVAPAVGNKPKGAPGHDKTLNLHPADRQSFKDFVGEKKPRDNFVEHNVVAVYWLGQTAEITDVTTDMVFTCYRGVSWKLPGDLRNSLAKTAHDKGWLDTKDSDDIKITPSGLNFVERDLPPKTKA